MRKFLVVFALVNFLFPNCSLGQKKMNDVKIDTSTVIKWLKDSQKLIYVDIEKSDSILQKAKQGSLDLDYDYGLAGSHDLQGIIYTIKGDLVAAEQAYRAAIELYEENEFFSNMAKSYGNLSIVYQQKGDYEQALVLQLKSIEISKELDDQKSIAKSYNNLGIIYQSIGDFQKAKESYLLAVDYGSRVVDDLSMCQFYNNLSVVYYELQQLDSAMKVVNSSLQISEKLDIQVAMQTSYEILGTIHAKKGDYRLAVHYHQLSLGIRLSNKMKYDLSGTYIGLGNDYVGLSMGDSAIHYFSLALKDNEYPIPKLDAYKGMTEAYILLSNKDSATFFMNQYIELKDSLLSFEKIQNLDRLQIEFDSEQLKTKIAQLEIQSVISENKATQRGHWITILVLLITIVAAIFIIVLLKRSAHNERKLADLKQRVLMAQMNPHFIFNSLNSIQRLYVEGKNDDASDYMADFSTLLRSILENNDKKIIPLSEEIKFLKLYCSIEKLRIGNLITFQFNISEKLDLARIKIPPMILQPIVENAIWHGVLPKAQPGKVIIDLHEFKAGQLKISIQDDGVGWDPDKKSPHQSKGIDLTEKRLDTKLKIENMNPGTLVSFTIKMVT